MRRAVRRGGLRPWWSPSRPRAWLARAAAVALAAALGVAAGAQEDIGERLLRDQAVRLALDRARLNEPAIIEEQVALCEIPAPPFGEGPRAAAVKRRFEQLGLRDVRIDEVGNVLGTRPGLASRPHVVMAAHLDTVFPEGTMVRVAREGAVLRAPGIGDDARGLAVLVGIVRALDEAKVQTRGSLTFVANVGEEGLGDLRGVRHLFRQSLKGRVDAFVSIDGTGTGITTTGVGSHRYRVTFKGPGGHSYGAFGLVNPAHALGRAVARIADLQVPSAPRVTFNVGRIGGGTSVNAIPYEAWFEIDLRSPDEAALQAVDARVRKLIEQAAAAENDRWGGRETLEVVTEFVGDRPAGRTPEGASIVRAILSVTQALGLPAPLGEGSTDANLPMSLGLPAVAIDGGGAGGGAHSLAEWFDSTDSWKGTQRAVLVALALAGR